VPALRRKRGGACDSACSLGLAPAPGDARSRSPAHARAPSPASGAITRPGRHPRAIECELEAPPTSRWPESCYFGPEYARISNERYEEIWQAHKSDPVELWHALLSEPEDPNLPAIELRVTSKSGPNCQSDYERKLESEASAIQKQLNFR
jgi:hypothetical protein